MLLMAVGNNRLAGGGSRPVDAYAGGISLGWQEPAALVEEALAHLATGYRALKLRVGDTPERDVARVTAVRESVPDDVVLLTDANTGYDLSDVRRVMPAYESLGVRWLEEPFPAHDYRSYRQAAAMGRVGLAAGENQRQRLARQLADVTIGRDGFVHFLSPFQIRSL